jgi:hypothetical protein
MIKSFSEKRNRLGRLCGLFGCTLLTAILVVAVPPFLAMPLWGDVTLYDVAAREIRHGGIHYRDVFDTNPPGFVWSLAFLRTLIGPSSEMLRAVDFCVVAAECCLLSALMRRSMCRSLGFFIAVALFYPFTSEFNHIQRDVWMLLPALGATILRVKRTPERVFLPSVVEGMMWGVAVWFKPHVIVPAIAVWLATCRAKSAGWDLLGQLTGGVAVGAIGIAYLVASGTWPYFHDVMTNWNPEYARNLFDELPQRMPWAINYFGIWDLIHFVAIPLAILELIRGDRSGRALAGLYFGWFLQAFVLQRPFPYVHVPEIFLGLAVVARWCTVGVPVLAWFLVLVPLGYWPDFAQATAGNDFFDRHPLTGQKIYDAWPRYLEEGSSPALRDQLGQYNSAHCGTQWIDLERIADFLRTADLHDGDLICWHDGTHPLYLMLDLKPGVRYMHMGTAWAFESKRSAIAEEVRNKHARYVVSDLRLLTTDMNKALAYGDSGKWYRLPAWVPQSQRDLFPWNQRIVFRSGRYIVHEMQQPLGRIHIASFEELEKEGK